MLGQNSFISKAMQLFMDCDKSSGQFRAAQLTSATKRRPSGDDWLPARLTTNQLRNRVDHSAVNSDLPPTTEVSGVVEHLFGTKPQRWLPPSPDLRD
jgi:hypothetical protein